MPWAKVSDHLFAIERNDSVAAVRKLHRQESTVQAESIAGEGGIDGDLLYLHFQHVARLRLCDCDRAGQDVTTCPLSLAG